VGGSAGAYPALRMIEQIIFRPAAEYELKKAYTWYESRVPGLGSEFMRAVDACVHLIRRNPNIYPVVYADVRQGIVRRFPYSVLYLVGPDRIVVISVFHSSRDPKVWQRRV